MLCFAVIDRPTRDPRIIISAQISILIFAYFWIKILYFYYEQENKII